MRKKVPKKSREKREKVDVSEIADLVSEIYFSNRACIKWGESRQEVYHKLNGILADPKVNIEHLAFALKEGKVKDLEEAVECASLEIVGIYFPIRRIARGGMKVVYEAIDRLGKHLAVKMFGGEQEKFLTDATRLTDKERIFKETINSIQLRDPHVAMQLVSTETKDGKIVFVEELMYKTLEDILRERKLTEEEVLTYGLQIAMGLEACHNNCEKDEKNRSVKRPILHQDLKPDNIGYKESGDGKGILMLFDFGLATYEQERHKDRKEIGGLLVRAPELFTAYVPSKKTDLYSLGVVLAWMALGIPPVLIGSAYDLNNLPFDPNNGREGLSQYITEKVCSDEYDQEVAELMKRMIKNHSLREVIVGLMKRDPQERYCCVEEVGARLQTGINLYNNPPKKS